ncbi:MAG TPA: tetratricopeptide repeat protein [Bacteroidales bacterium]|nr:tetratricopeptide repeat protein [Bacteroidales bacterium]HNS45952.1 tetratricopeptide repeat protein [Bacteroidales bacterium]
MKNVAILTIGLLFLVLTPGCKAPPQTAIPFDPSSVEAYKPGENSPQRITALFIDAKKEALLGNAIKAEAMFLSVIEKDPRRDAAFYELAKLYSLQNNLTDARIMAEKALALAPDNHWYKELLAELYQRNQNYAQAIRLYDDLARDFPHDMEYRFQLAACYVFAGKFNEALGELDKIEARLGVSEEIVRQKERLYLFMDKVEEAAAEIRKLILVNPGESRYYSWLAELYMSQGQPEKALEVYNQVAEKFPDDPYIHISLSDYYRKKGDKERAQEELKLGFSNPALDIDTKIQVMLSFYSMSELFEEIRPRAMELAQILVKTHPDNPKAYSMYADFLVRDRQFREARDAFYKVISLDSSKFLVWESLLRVEAELEDYDAMKRESQRMIELFPVQPIGYLFNGVARMQLKEYREAIESFKTGLGFVVANNLLSSQFNAYLGDASYQAQDIPAAFEYYDKTLQLDPDNSYVLNNYSYYLSLRKENLDKAEAMALRATQLDPGNMANLDTYGWVLFMQKKYEEAEQWIKKALDQGGVNDPDILEHYGDVLFKLGKTNEAIHYWKTALEKGPGSGWLEKKVRDGKLYE